MTNKLAIIIPAYKSDYLQEALNSIATQSCQKFTLYIGDDASPNQLYKIVQLFEKKIKIEYRQFKENLGGQDLVAHWERCIGMSKEEEWIWLFSDDDIMEPNCVEEFYKYIESNNSVSLLHFNVSIINSHGILIENPVKFPKLLNITDFFDQRINYRIKSFVVEYIFKRELYLNNGKFQNFDLAWCSDDATWIKFASTNGIKTIEDAKIKWRLSYSNISSIFDNKDIVARKLNSNISYLKWVKGFFIEKNLIETTSNFKVFRWGIMPIKDSATFSLKEKIRYSSFFCKELKMQYLTPFAFAYIIASKIKSILRFK